MKNCLRLLSIIAIIISAITWTACENNKFITDYDKGKLNIITYSDDTEVNGGFTFTATESWNTYIDYGTAVRSGNEWITLDPASGGAGDVTMEITLEPNTTGADRSATIRIICGETTLEIVIVQRGTENNGDDGTQDNDSTGNGDEPTQKIDEYAIARITQTIDQSGQTVVYKYSFRHEDDDPCRPIKSVRVDGLPREDGAATIYDGSIEMTIERELDKLYINLYGNGHLYETYEASHNGRYIESLTYNEEIGMGIGTGTGPEGGNSTIIEEFNGIENHTYYFNRTNSRLYRTDYVCETIFEGHEEYNQTNEITYNLEWDITNDGHDIYFNNPYNLTQLSWTRDMSENYEYMSYNPNINTGNIMGTKRPIEAPGNYIDINHMITTFWFEGTYRAYGECYTLLGLIGWISAPSYNMISGLSYKYGEWQGSNVNVEYHLNENSMIDKFVMSNYESSAVVEIEYLKY